MLHVACESQAASAGVLALRCIFFAITIALGIPVVMGWKLWHAREAIADHRGPHHLENLCKIAMLSRFACCPSR